MQYFKAIFNILKLLMNIFYNTIFSHTGIKISFMSKIKSVLKHVNC